MQRWIWTVVCALFVIALTPSAALAQEEGRDPSAQPAAPAEAEQEPADEAEAPAPMDAPMPAPAPIGPAIPWEEQVETFFERVEAGEPEAAIDFLYADNPWAGSVAEQLGGLKAQLAGVSDLVGTYLGYEVVATRPLSDRFIHVLAMGFYENQPLQFHFSFYQPRDRWHLYQFSYEEGVVNLAKELMRRELVGDEP